MIIDFRKLTRYTLLSVVLTGFFLVVAVPPTYAYELDESFENTYLGEIPDSFTVLWGTAEVQTISQKNTFQGRGLRIDPESAVEMKIPDEVFGDFDFRFDIKPGKRYDSTLMFRATDENNGYAFTIGRDSHTLARRDSGKDTSFGEFDKDNVHWARFKIQASLDQILVTEIEGGGSGTSASGAGKKEGAVKGSGQEIYVGTDDQFEIIDATYSSGRLIFVNPTSERIYLDNILITSDFKMSAEEGGCGGSLAP